MAKILQKIKNLLAPITSSPIQTKPAKTKKKSKKKVTPEQEVQTLEQLKQNINTSGYYSMKISSLFRIFNFQKRSAANVEKVLGKLEEVGLFVAKRAISDKIWHERVRIYKFPVEQLGHTFKSEKYMEDAFATNHWYQLLDLNIKIKPETPGEKSDRQFSPDGTRDRLDFRALDIAGNNVVLELKHEGGDKRLIEQVLRYRTDLMHHFKTDAVRCIIITGERCLHTAKAFWSLPAHDKSVITWYLYKWNKEIPGKITFEEVTPNFLSQYLAQAEN